MHHFGYKQRKIAMTGAAIEVVPSGKAVEALIFNNESGSAVVFSGTGISDTGSQEFVVVVPANDSRVVDVPMYAVNGLEFTSTADVASVTAIYDTTR